MAKKKAIDLDRAKAMYAAEATLGEIAALEGVASQTVGRRLTEAGIVLHDRKRTARHRQRVGDAHRFPLDEAELRHLSDLGWSTAEIGQQLGCSAECIRDRMIKLGIERLPAKARMHKNVFWNGGRTVDKHGYVLVKAPDHPYRNRSGYIREHRLVMELKLGRYLTRDEVVHHIDDNPANNDPDNLRLYRTNGAHLAETIAGQVPQWTEQGRANILAGLQRGRDKLAASHRASKTDGDQ